MYVFVCGVCARRSLDMASWTDTVCVCECVCVRVRCPVHERISASHSDTFSVNAQDLCSPDPPSSVLDV